VAFEHLGELAYRRRELVEIGAAVGVEPDLREDLGVQPDLLAIEDRDPALDNPSRSSRSIRRQQGEADRPTASATAAVDNPASS
jgi:hypothetical protein